jgi:predicted nuclease of predicted toxin-antitoxin system
VTQAKRVVLDECIPHRLRLLLSNHDVMTASYAGLAGLKNGQLMKAIDARFDVLVTLDSGLPYQQNLVGLTFGIVVLRAQSNSMKHLVPLVPALLVAIGLVLPSQVEMV